MINRESVPFTPDGSVSWQCAETSHGTLYAPEEMLAESGLILSMRRARDFGPRIGGGCHGESYRQGDLVLKDSQFLAGDAAFWDRCAGMTAVQMNVALQVGLDRIGDLAVLPSGARLVAPRILGMYVVHDELAVRTLMTFEDGRHPDSPDDVAVMGTRLNRRHLYNAAYHSVGGDIHLVNGYDDTPGNLLLRQAPSGEEVVKIDTCNYRESDEPWKAFAVASFADR